MGLKSVVDIDLNDEKFKRFTDRYQKYQEALKKQPQAWKDAEKSIDDTGDAVDKIIAAFMAMGDTQRELREDNEKDNRNLRQKASLWDKINKASTGVLKDAEGVAKWMLKWGGIGLGLSIGGLFGLRAIAEDVANQRNKALGLDTGIGTEKAFALHQGRYFDNPDAILSGAFTARSNLASPAFQAIASLGINPNQPTVAIANQLLTKLQAMAKSLPQQQVGNLLQEYPGIAQFGIGLQDLERLRNISPAELQQQIKGGTADAKAFNLSDRQGQAFQNFVTGIDSTFGKVTKQIERDLVPLLGPIEKLVSSIGKDISMLLRSKAAADGIDAIAKSIDRFAGYLGSSTFRQDLNDFEDGARTFLNVIGFAAHVVAHPLDTFKEGVGDLWQEFTTWAKGKEAAAHGGDANWKESEQRKRDGFISDMRGHVNSHAPAAAGTPTAMVRPGGGGTQNVVALAHVRVDVRNMTGGDLNYAVNQLNGGVA